MSDCMKDNDNYVYLGNHRYIRKDLMAKTVEEYNKKQEIIKADASHPRDDQVFIETSITSTKDPLGIISQYHGVRK